VTVELLFVKGGMEVPEGDEVGDPDAVETMIV